MHCFGAGTGHPWVWSPTVCIDLRLLNSGAWASADLGICEGSWNQYPADTEGHFSCQGVKRCSQICDCTSISTPNPRVVQGPAVHLSSAFDQSVPLMNSYQLCKMENYLSVLTTNEVCIVVPALERLLASENPFLAIAEPRDMVWVIHLQRQQRCLYWDCLLSFFTQMVFQK